MTAPRVSVLMPVYNAAETLVQTLESIAGQSFEDFEVVAVDDGSEDGSGEILQGWVEKDCRFRVLLEEHRGIVETPNRGLGECRGEFVARMAADDKMHPQRLDKQVGMLDADEGLSVVSCLVETFPREDVGAGDDYLRRVVERLGRGRGYFAEFFHREPDCQSVGDDAAAPCAVSR
ncbi:MAG: glycosyltransferase family 2 protein [Gemmatimonadetes bacterium]|nr:glycosyltransferase family 2 protein [Gemmatimonadota bacterium]